MSNDFYFFLPSCLLSLYLCAFFNFSHLFSSFNSFNIFLHFTISIREPQTKRHAVPMAIPATPFITLKNIPPFAQKYRTNTNETNIAKTESAIYLYIMRILFPQYSLSCLDISFYPFKLLLIPFHRRGQEEMIHLRKTRITGRV